MEGKNEYNFKGKKSITGAKRGQTKSNERNHMVASFDQLNQTGAGLVDDRI